MVDRYENEHYRYIRLYIFVIEIIYLTISAADPNPKYSISCLTSSPTTWQDKTSAMYGDRS